jgi:hypothetical protein
MPFHSNRSWNAPTNRRGNTLNENSQSLQSEPLPDSQVGRVNKNDHKRPQPQQHTSTQRLKNLLILTFFAPLLV